jgi:superfamily II DNA or RNA helicase
LRDHQKQAVAVLKAAVSAGRSGFLNADDVGLGKTIETWAGVLDMRQVETVLIVCPLAVVAHWRRTIQWMGDAGSASSSSTTIAEEAVRGSTRDRLSIGLPRKKRKVRKVRTAKGIARYGEAYGFDLIVWDESHKLRNP